jgi:hypothetical protein
MSSIYKYAFLFLSTILLTLSNVATVQAQRTCHAHDHLHQIENQDPSVKAQRDEIEKFTAAYIKSQGGVKGRAATFNIPVVVHVIYNANVQNITDAQVLSQLAVLNADFQKLNSDFSRVPTPFQSLAGDAGIQFCLASKDPNGNPTTGITRTYTAKTAFDVYNDDAKYTAMGGHDAWNRNAYLNFWIVPTIKAGTQTSILGYGQFPGGPASTDGIVIGYRYFGTMGTASAPFDKGRTATHEVGHWLNLYHIWGDDTNCVSSDMVSDTPNQGSENYGCPTFPRSSCNNGTSGDMFMNYMDYTDDACMNMFSNGQRLRMNAVLAPGGPRASLATSDACNSAAPTTTTASVCGVPGNTRALYVYANSGTISWDGVANAKSYILDYKPSNSSVWSSTIVNNTTIYTLTNLAASTSYDYRVKTNCGSALSTFADTKVFSTISSTAVCVTPIAVTSSNVSSTSATVTWSDMSNVLNYTLQYKTANATTWNVVSNIRTMGLNIVNLQANTQYYYQLKSNCSATSSSSFGVIYGFRTAANSNSCSDVFEVNNTSLQAKTLTTNAITNASIGVRGDIDWFSFKNSATQKNIQITLSNLAADYDLKLYGPDGRQVATSEHEGLVNEVVKFNSTVVGTYKVKIYGYSGAFSSTQCYSLNVQLGASNFKGESQDSKAALAENTRGLLEDDVLVYPNPVSDYMNIFIPEDKMSDHIAARIVDQTGRLVRSFEYGTTPEISMDMSTYMNGVYFLQIIKDNKVITKRFVVAQ